MNTQSQPFQYFICIIWKWRKLDVELAFTLQLNSNYFSNKILKLADVSPKYERDKSGLPTNGIKQVIKTVYSH